MNSKVLSWSVIFCALISLPFVFNSCQKSSSPSSSSAAAQSVQCRVMRAGADLRAKVSAEPKTLPFASAKVHLRNSNKISANGTVPSGSELSILADNSCVKNSNNQSVLANVIAAGHPHPMLQQQAYTWTLGRDYNESEIQALVDQHACVLGVSWNQHYKVQTTSIIGSQVGSGGSSGSGSTSSPATSNVTFNDPLFTQQEHFNALRAPQAYAGIYDVSGGLSSTVGSPVLIAVVDTGVDWTHPDISGNLWEHSQGMGIDATTIGSGLVDFNPFDVSSIGHGTHVSGLIAAVTNNNLYGAGVMPFRAQIMAIKVYYLDSSGDMLTSSTDLANGINFATNNGANVINISLSSITSGPSSDPVTETAITGAVNAGLTVVVVIGNNDSGAGQLIDGQTTSSIPGQYATTEGVIGVGSIDTSTMAKSYFSDYSTTYAEIGAPGAVSSGASVTPQGLLSTIPTGINPAGYGRLAGTSQAAPMVSAAAGLTYGLIKGATGTAPTPAQIESLIEGSAIQSTALEPYFMNGNQLDLPNLVYLINEQFPATLGGRTLPTTCP